MAEIKFPLLCITAAQKTAWLYRAQEKLRDLHNVFVKWREDELSKEEYDALPLMIKGAYPRVTRLSLETQKRFLKEEFDPRSEKISHEIATQRAVLKKSTRWNMDIGEI